MMVEITITLSAELYLRLTLYAAQLGIRVEEAATTLLENAFPPLVSELDNRPIASLSDADLIDAKDNMIDETPTMRAQLLRIWHETRELSDVEQIEMQMWNAWYDANQLRKVKLNEERLKRRLQ